MLLLLFENILLFFSELLEDGVLTKQPVSALDAVKSKVSVSWLPLRFVWSDFCAQTLRIFVDHFLLGTNNSSFLGNKVISNGSTFC